MLSKEKIISIIKKPYIMAFMGFLLMFILMSILSPRFLNINNLSSITRQIAINSILAIGMTFVILTGGIDLSVGSVAALSGTVIAILLKSGLGTPIALIAGLAMGAAFGAVSGFFISKRVLPAIIVTLSMSMIARGIALLMTGGYPVSDIESPIFNIAVGVVPTILVLVLTLCAWFYLTYMKAGRYLYAIGSNEDALFMSGINVSKFKWLAYILCGFTSAVAGVMLLARTHSGQPNAGTGFEMDAIAAVVLGGASISGGTGHIVGTIIGACTLGLISNGLNLLNINPFTQQVIKGLIILGAILIGSRKKAK